MPTARQQANSAQDSSQITGRIFLLVQPVSQLGDDVTEQIEQVSQITKLDSYTVRQKLIGSAPELLTIGDNSKQLTKTRDSLRNAGFNCACVRESDLSQYTRLSRALSAKSTDEALSFLNSRDEVIGSLGRAGKALVLLGSLDPANYGAGKEILRTVYGVKDTAESTALRRISEIAKATPALIVYPSGDQAPFHLIGNKFNYSSLGGKVKLSIAQNFRDLLDTIQTKTECVLHTEFGLRTLPIIPLAGNSKSIADSLKKFIFYSQLIYLAIQDGFLEAQSNPASDPPLAHQQNTSDPMPMLGVVGGLATIGARQGGIIPGVDTYVAEPKSATTVEQNKPDTSLPPPPPPNRGAVGSLSVFKRYYSQLQLIGPAPLATMLIIWAIAGIYLGVDSRNIDTAWGVLPLGILFTVGAITMFQRKRIIQNTPTSKLRSMHMGSIEITGEAKRKYNLRSPFSLVDCVYYRYKVLKKEIRHSTHSGSSEHWVVKERGDSGPVQFYLDDGTGRVLIDPAGAIITGMQTEEYMGSMADMLTGSASDKNRRVIESIIPVGARLYILGHARPIKNSADEKRKEYHRRLQELKRSPEKLAAYDADRDGDISMEEWSEARSDVEEQMLLESLAADKKADSAVVGKGPGSGLFFISDKHEVEILASYRWKLPLLALTGASLIIHSILELFGSNISNLKL